VKGYLYERRDYRDYTEGQEKFSRWENEREDIGITSDKLIRLIFIQNKEEEDTHFSQALEYIASVKKRKIKKAIIKIPMQDIKKYKSFGKSLAA